ncbi:2-isopropylmalate synthase [Lachnospiraceae bacterium NSJ-143]|nr:2-isopropylmalate synthase [Lachnospiraceae bacterium NSJ-143]
MNYTKYRPYPTMNMPNRKWPDKVIEKAPIWCSVDLRDGNQSLEIPMNLEEKIGFFKFLVKTGFKEIEIGFPAASDTEYEFARYLIENNMIPDDVTVQVLTQSRPHIIKKTFQALKGVKRAIVHLYNSTSTLQRDVVFNASMEQTTALAVAGAELLMEEAAKQPETEFMFQYSPESFTGTETPYAVEICNAVIDVWKPTPGKKIIINLPSTVEMATANVYADQIEYCCDNLKCRDSIIVSLHSHNDRGLAVAETEFGIMAGADRVEGTLFGNGERTGNVDIMTVAMNLFTQGIDPELDFSHIDDAVEIYEKSTRMTVHPRHPYAGALVYTAFSGSHQDAIRKGMDRMKEHPDRWEVPYLAIDPKDVGRTYDPIVRINSQSGKGGVAFILEQNFGLYLPKAFQQDFSLVITKLSDVNHKDVEPKVIFDKFNDEYVNKTEPVKLITYTEINNGESDVSIEAVITDNGEEKTITGSGNGVIDAFCHAMVKYMGIDFEIVNYSEHSMEYGTKSRAISYIQLSTSKGGVFYGAGISSNITKSSLRAVVSAANKILTK